jgi:hypothetical protein
VEKVNLVFNKYILLKRSTSHYNNQIMTWLDAECGTRTPHRTQINECRWLWSISCCRNHFASCGTNSSDFEINFAKSCYESKVGVGEEVAFWDCSNDKCYLPRLLPFALWAEHCWCCGCGDCQ